MDAESFDVVIGVAKRGKLLLARVGRSGIDGPDRERAAK